MQQSINNESNYTTVSEIVLHKDSVTANLTGLSNGTAYYYRLIVDGGIHDGISNIVSTSPTLVDASKSVVTLSTPLAPGMTSTLTVTIKDSNGLPIQTADAYRVIVVVAGNSNPYFTINNEQYNLSCEKLILTPASGGGITLNELRLPYNLDFVILNVTDVNGNLIGSTYTYTSP